MPKIIKKVTCSKCGRVMVKRKGEDFWIISFTGSFQCDHDFPEGTWD